MKVKEAIAQLSELDQEAELVGNNGEAIHFFEYKQGYWDGSYVELIRDPAKKPYWDIVGAKLSRSGYKVAIHMLDIQDLIWGDSEFPIYSSTGAPLDYEELRTQVRECDKEMMLNEKLSGSIFNKVIIVFEHEHYYKAYKEKMQEKYKLWRANFCYDLFNDKLMICQVCNVDSDAIDEIRDMVSLMDDQPLLFKIVSKNEPI